MKTFFSDIIPKLQRYSHKLDNLTLLTNQHWVVIDEMLNSKNVYIFRANNELLISQNGKVEKARWEYLGNNSLLIDRKNESYLFKHGFFDENILALKVDSKEEYAFLINENKFDGELNSLNKVIEFLSKTYLEPEIRRSIEGSVGKIEENPKQLIQQEVNYNTTHEVKYNTIIGEIKIVYFPYKPILDRTVTINKQLAPDGKYKIGFMSYIHVLNGKLIKISKF